MLPFLSTRFKFPSHLSSAGHVELQEKVVDIEEMVSNLNVGESIAELAWALSTKYGPCLRDHLQEEETRYAKISFCIRCRNAWPLSWCCSISV